MARGWLGRTIGAALFASLPVPALAQNFPGTVSLTVVRSGTVVKEQDLLFGNMYAGATTGRVFIDPVSGARTSTGGVTLMPSLFQPAQFTAAGTPNQRLRITLPGTVTLNRSGGGATMTVTNFDRDGPNGNGQLRFAANGIFTFRVGGRLNVGANQMPGDYAGAFTVTVDYQ